jgi:hypothetical protein
LIALNKPIEKTISQKKIAMTLLQHNLAADVRVRR